MVQWAAKIAQCRNKQIAAVALARKMAGIAFALWRDETDIGLAFVLCGHSHLRMVRHFDHLTVVNAGTLLPDRAGFCTVDFEQRNARFFDIASTMRIAEVAEVDFAGPGWPRMPTGGR